MLRFKCDPLSSSVSPHCPQFTSSSFRDLNWPLTRPHDPRAQPSEYFAEKESRKNVGVILVGFEVLTAVGLRGYNAMQSMEVCRQYGETYGLLLQGRRMLQVRDKHEAGINRSSAFAGLHDIWSQKMTASCDCSFLPYWWHKRSSFWWRFVVGNHFCGMKSEFLRILKPIPNLTAIVLTVGRDKSSKWSQYSVDLLSSILNEFIDVFGA
jgi:hypothetical protein